MKKQIEISLEAARQMYKEGNETTNKWLLENFTKEELEPKKGFNWEDVHRDKWPQHLYCIVPLTDKHEKSMTAFSKLSHIVNRYNQGKERGAEVYAVHGSTINGLEVDTFGRFGHQLEFYSQESAQISAEVNRQLWLDYWMID